MYNDCSRFASHLNTAGILHRLVNECPGAILGNVYSPVEDACGIQVACKTGNKTVFRPSTRQNRFFRYILSEHHRTQILLQALNQAQQHVRTGKTYRGRTLTEADFSGCFTQGETCGVWK